MSANEKRIYPSTRNHPSYICHKIIEPRESEGFVIVKDTTTGRVGELVEDTSAFLNSDEKVAIRHKNPVGFSDYYYNFDPKGIHGTHGLRGG